MQDASPWLVFIAYCAATWWVTPRRVDSPQFFDGADKTGRPPSVWLVAMSAAITWIFAKSIANAADLAYSYGIVGGIGYALYYLSFVVAGVVLYLLRSRFGYRSIPEFLRDKYGAFCAKIFLLTIAFRLFNEVWSNTKVISLYFGPEGSTSYWLSAVLVTAFTVAYAWTGGMRASLITDRLQTIVMFALLGLVLVFVFPGLERTGLPSLGAQSWSAGLTFCGLALVQIFSYPFHDPVLTDRAFLNSPRQMLKSFLLAGVMSGLFILLFSFVGLYGRAFGLAANPLVSVPGAFGLTMLLVFNGIALLSGGSTIDSTFTSVAKLAARDWSAERDLSRRTHLTTGRLALLSVAVIGNLPLLTIYLGEKIGPAIIAATTISGTMVMGLAPIFLLAWLRPAGKLSFHLAYWPGFAFGVLRAVETFAGLTIFPPEISLGTGKFSIDLGLNVWGLLICTSGYLLGSVWPSPIRHQIADQRA